jgi:hypothetical protein
MLAAVALSVGVLGGVALPAPSAHAAVLPAAVSDSTREAPARSPLPVDLARRVLGTVSAATRVDASAARMMRVETAVGRLAGAVRRQSHPDALRLAFQAYYNYRNAHPREVRKPYLYFVDYGLGANTPRGYVFDMDALAVVEGPFAVAHGRGSAAVDGVPTQFSNRPGSNATSLGLFLAQETYGFNGSSGGGHYTSIGLRMRGLSGLFNSRARARGVVVHGAPYVSDQSAGRSEGCPAMEQSRARRLIPLISNGGLVFLFSPLDPAWLRSEPWSNDLEGKLAMARR